MTSSTSHRLRQGRSMVILCGSGWDAWPNGQKPTFLERCVAVKWIDWFLLTLIVMDQDPSSFFWMWVMTLLDSLDKPCETCNPPCPYLIATQGSRSVMSAIPIWQTQRHTQAWHPRSWSRSTAQWLGRCWKPAPRFKCHTELRFEPISQRGHGAATSLDETGDANYAFGLPVPSLPFNAPKFPQHLNLFKPMWKTPTRTGSSWRANCKVWKLARRNRSRHWTLLLSRGSYSNWRGLMTDWGGRSRMWMLWSNDWF